MKKVTGRATGFTLIELIVSIALIVILLGLSAGFIRVTTTSEIDTKAGEVVSFFSEAYELAASREHPVELIFEEGALVSSQVGDQLTFSLGEGFNWRWRNPGQGYRAMSEISIRMDRDGCALPVDLLLKKENESLLVQIKPFQGRATINHDTSGK